MLRGIGTERKVELSCFFKLGSKFNSAGLLFFSSGIKSYKQQSAYTHRQVHSSALTTFSPSYHSPPTSLSLTTHRYKYTYTNTENFEAPLRMMDGKRVQIAEGQACKK